MGAVKMTENYQNLQILAKRSNQLIKQTAVVWAFSQYQS